MTSSSSAQVGKSNAIEAGPMSNLTSAILEPGVNMKTAEFRKELTKIMPGYKWTIQRTSTPEQMTAEGIQSSGFNRLSTLQVVRTEKADRVRYTVRSAPYGTKSPWASEASDITLARALRELQKHYESEAANYLQLAERLAIGRKPTTT